MAWTSTIKKPAIAPATGMQAMPSHVSDPQKALREALLRKMKGC